MMNRLFLTEAHLRDFVTNLISTFPVIGPVAKKTKFVFHELESADELRLDYDTTILPPKKVFFPPKQDLIAFNKNSFDMCVEPRNAILFGVHPHDIKGITMTDLLFNENYADHNYLANRNSTTIVGSSVQNHYKYAFFGSINRDLPLKGHDMFLTKIEGGYVVEVITPKGETLLKHGSFTHATEQQVTEAEKVNLDALNNSPENLEYGAQEIHDRIRHSFNSKIWEELAEDCFSCASCNIVCPTCYCFDVQDEWGLDECSGKRYRQWDACLSRDFAQVSIQGGQENFRESRAERYRHRFMRKSAYLNEKLGGPACIGCGRCSGACTSDIANPVQTLHKVIKDSIQQDKKPICGCTVITKENNIFLPKEAEIVSVKQMTQSEKHFTLRLKNGEKLSYQPGQILEAGLFGYGEIPLGFSSSPTQTEKDGTFEVVIRKVGKVSSALCALQQGDTMTIRGPLGHGFPVQEFKGNDVLIIAGGIGLCPTRSMIRYILDKRDEFKRFFLFFGTRSPADQLFKEDLEDWRLADGIEYLETVDQADKDWKGKVGVITTLFSEIDTLKPTTKVIICGPPIIYKYVLDELRKYKIPLDNIFVDLERRMKCGIGKCGHCQMNDKYVCLDGPVFKYSDIKDLEEAIS